MPHRVQKSFIEVRIILLEEIIQKKRISSSKSRRSCPSSVSKSEMKTKLNKATRVGLFGLPFLLFFCLASKQLNYIAGSFIFVQENIFLNAFVEIYANVIRIIVCKTLQQRT